MYSFENFTCIELFFWKSFVKHELCFMYRFILKEKITEISIVVIVYIKWMMSRTIAFYTFILRGSSHCGEL